MSNKHHHLTTIIFLTHYLIKLFVLLSCVLLPYNLVDLYKYKPLRLSVGAFITVSTDSRTSSLTLRLCL